MNRRGRTWTSRSWAAWFDKSQSSLLTPFRLSGFLSSSRRNSFASNTCSQFTLPDKEIKRVGQKRRCGAVSLRYKPAPKSPSLCVNKSRIAYGFRFCLLLGQCRHSKRHITAKGYDTCTLRHTLLRDFSCVTVGVFSAVVWLLLF